MAERYTSVELVENVRNGRYLQLSLEDLRRLLREGSVNLNHHYSSIQLEQVQQAATVVRDHLAVMESERQTWLADERERRGHERLGAIEGKLADLKKPHWTVNPNFWFTVTSAIAAVIGVVVLLIPSCVNPFPSASPPTQAVSPKEPVSLPPPPVPLKAPAPVSIPPLPKKAPVDIPATPPKKEESKPQ